MRTKADWATIAAMAMGVTLAMGVGAARANLVTNGDFEDAGDPITTTQTGWWTFSDALAGTEDQSANFDNETGPIVAFMQSSLSNDGGSIYQTVTLETGRDYTLSAGVGRRLDHDTLSLPGASWRLVVFNSDFSVEIAGEPDPRGEFGQGDGGHFVDQLLVFSVPTAGTYHVGVRHRGTVGSDAFSQLNVDNVQLIAAPAPAALPMGLAVLAAIGLRRRR